VGNYVIATPSNLGNFMIADTQTGPTSPPALREVGQAGQATGLDEARVNCGQVGGRSAWAGGRLRDGHPSPRP
jgi:hypothetical protein